MSVCGLHHWSAAGVDCPVCSGETVVRLPRRNKPERTDAEKVVLQMVADGKMTLPPNEAARLFAQWLLRLAGTIKNLE